MAPAPIQHTTAEKLAELYRRLELAKEPGGEKAAAKRDKKGIPSARARIHALVDPGTFLETGALAKTPNDPNALYGDGCVTGHAMIDGRPVGLFSHDQTVFQGTVGEMFGRKVARLMEWCAMVGCPIIGIQDSGGARIQDAVTSLAWYAELGRRHEALSGLVPQISLIFGKCAGGAVYSPIQDDLLVSVRDQGYFFVTGPDVIREVTGEEVTLDELGGSDAQARYGNIHHVVNTEAEAFQYVREYLSFLPSNCFDQPPIVNPGWSPRSRRPTSSSTRSCRTRTTCPTTCTRSCCGSSTTATSSRWPPSTARPSSPATPASTATPWA
ncbi:propionyl-CoA carboxylase complex B subunit [Mycobacterium avium subsp. avium 2285 (R)]|nr:propionyl-CoA carboxylase complex B subunit [Mycobacterium avium subsp. avium 2285 (R)]